jgi:tripartite-type tricarboxylate transporter receptor subunit TctC
MKAGKLHALAVTGASRAGFAPDLPTIAESGLKGYEVSGWFGIFAPAGTPQPVIDVVSRAVATAVKDPEIRNALAKDGDAPVGNSPSQFAKEVQADMEKWGKVIRDGHIELE